MTARTPMFRLDRLLHLSRDAIRYAVAGGLVALWYIGATLALRDLAGLPIQAAIPIAYVTAMVLHFVLQRTFVFAHQEEFHLSADQQAGRYVLIALVQYSITATATALLPDLLGLDERIVYVGCVLTISASTFLFLRSRVFHAPTAP